MKTWNQLFIRHGWMVQERDANVFDCSGEREENIAFLVEVLDSLNISYQKEKRLLVLQNPPISEGKWIAEIDFPNRGVSEGFWFQPGEEEPKVKELDTYISGIVRQLNRLGFLTIGSCDGHGSRTPHVMLTKDAEIERLIGLLHVLGVKARNLNRRNNHLSLHMKREQLLDVTEKLSNVEKEWVIEGQEFIKKQLFQKKVGELLGIPGVSGNERQVREAVKEKLTPFVDYVTTDHYGNLLAEKTYRSGHGPTILLNAHLDVASEIKPNREILKNENIWSSSEGILGADDRAGVAVLLQVAESLMTSSFSGKVKYIFTVEEEIGLVGASHVDEYFLWGVDAAIVVDRRGLGDIVTSCGNYFPLCNKTYGEFLENIALKEGLVDWACTSGGSSDTRIWAEHGIQSVNLSVGYWNEHTEEEKLDVDAAYETVKMVEAVFNHARKLRELIRREGRNAV